MSYKEWQRVNHREAMRDRRLTKQVTKILGALKSISKIGEGPVQVGDLSFAPLPEAAFKDKNTVLVGFQGDLEDARVNPQLNDDGQVEVFLPEKGRRPATLLAINYVSQIISSVSEFEGEDINTRNGHSVGTTQDIFESGYRRPILNIVFVGNIQGHAQKNVYPLAGIYASESTLLQS